MEIFEFIFQDFLHWFGTLGLLVAMSFWRLVEVNIDRSTQINGAKVEEAKKVDD